MSLKNDLVRTLTFVVVAVVGVTAAAVTHYVQQPGEVQGYEQVGKPFYPEFDNPNDAKSLRVVDYDEGTATVREFEVKFKDGLWRIPSHHNYPADAEDQLAETAASVIGIKREALVTRRESAHEDYNVIDPLKQEAGSLKGRGERITLESKDGSRLADFIIGKQVPDRDGYYYVRRQDEDAVYMARLDIDLSTKFEDWIEQDLLKVERFNLRELAVIRPSFDDQGRIIVGEDKVLRLKKEGGSGGPRGAGGSGDWQLVGLSDESKEVNDDAVRGMTRALDDLKIIGVRPKPKGITADLSLDVPSDVANNPMQLQAFQQSRLRDLMRRGFVIAFDQNDKARLYSREGEVTGATSEGVVYHLHFGDLVTGSQQDIQIGGTSDGESEDEAEGEKSEDEKSGGSAEDGSEQEANAEQEGEDGEDDGTKPGRYLFVRAEFDASYIGEKPQKPARPEALTQAEAKEGEKQDDASEESDSGKVDNPEGGQKKSPANETEGDTAAKNDSQEDGKASGNKEGGEDDGDGKEAEPDIDKLRQEYQQKLEQYKNDLSQYEDKVEEGRKKVEELNRRFGNWYYVIAAEHFDKLSVSRDDLVKEKEKEESEADGESRPIQLPGQVPGGGTKGGQPVPKSGTSSEAGRPAPQQKPGDDKKPAEAETPSKDDASGDSKSENGSSSASDEDKGASPSDKQSSKTANEAQGA